MIISLNDEERVAAHKMEHNIISNDDKAVHFGWLNFQKCINFDVDLSQTIFRGIKM